MGREDARGFITPPHFSNLGGGDAYRQRRGCPLLDMSVRGQRRTHSASLLTGRHCHTFRAVRLGKGDEPWPGPLPATEQTLGDPYHHLPLVDLSPAGARVRASGDEDAAVAEQGPGWSLVVGRVSPRCPRVERSGGLLKGAARRCPMSCGHP